MSKELLQRALDALTTAVNQNQHDMLMTGEECRASEEAIAALEAAIAQPVQPADNCKLLAELAVLREALKSNEQCVTDFIEVYKRGASMLVMDEAVKSLRDDGLKLARAALANKQGAQA